MKRSRKGGHREHLAKVSDRSEARHEQHLEREAVADVMGFGGAPPWLKWTLLAVGAVIVAVALALFIGLF